ncbi:hypothetical protein BIY24_01050 [Halobacteriovorax marinus]|uniref:DUF420 domain-containing protein n=1 Tax=Halobacteriovorax marinus TaxID=97084 RepID=UPI000BC2ECC5|nr:DUF420 domain-containing protein [Halobacteriovorax marinus]ATH06577.1 hypothetical protein BIY24_01050 [Halobacteriovorax marinus]
MQEKQNNNTAYTAIGIVSFITISFLVWLIYFKTPHQATGDWVEQLPAINALLNSISFVLLCSGYVFIKKGLRSLHIKSMIAATISSFLFVASYITYHHFHGDTKFLAEGPIKYIYFTILITHIVLSIPLVPLVLTTLYHAYAENFSSHKKLAKITFPIWVYISVTGVLIYLILNNFNV